VEGVPGKRFMLSQGSMTHCFGEHGYVILALAVKKLVPKS
jgi:hypothetical protein